MGHLSLISVRVWRRRWRRSDPRPQRGSPSLFDRSRPSASARRVDSRRFRALPISAASIGSDSPSGAQRRLFPSCAAGAKSPRGRLCRRDGDNTPGASRPGGYYVHDRGPPRRGLESKRREGCHACGLRHRRDLLPRRLLSLRAPIFAVSPGSWTRWRRVQGAATPARSPGAVRACTGYRTPLLKTVIASNSFATLQPWR